MSLTPDYYFTKVFFFIKVYLVVRAYSKLKILVVKLYDLVQKLPGFYIIKILLRFIFSPFLWGYRWTVKIINFIKNGIRRTFRILFFIPKVFIKLWEKLIFFLFANFFTWFSVSQKKIFKCVIAVYSIFCLLVVLDIPFWFSLMSISGMQFDNIFIYIVSFHWFYLINILWHTSVDVFHYYLWTLAYDIFYIASIICPADLFRHYVWLQTFKTEAYTIALVSWESAGVDTVGEYIYNIRNFYNDPSDRYNITSLTRFLCVRTLALLIKSLYDSLAISNETIYTCFLMGWLFFTCSTILSFFFISYLGLYGVLTLNMVTGIIFWLFTILQINTFWLSNEVFSLTAFKWFSLFGYYKIMFEVQLDTLSYSYVLLTLTIAIFVFMYTFSYFRYEPNVERLMLFINLFVSSMILLVSGGNFFVFYLGWELIGITSFFLINFWSTRMSTLKAAFKAYTFNKCSDVCLFFAFLLSLTTAVDLNIIFTSIVSQSVSNLTYLILSNPLQEYEYIVGLLLVSAFIKSAQFGFHSWLPDSMEAPVPASALIHSATLVSAGIYLITRFSFLFELSNNGYFVILLAGALTAFYGGVGAMFQSDVKRILAFSTISHCGFLMITTALKMPEVTLFYLYVHGFFKAAVFLCVGNIIRFSQNYQDFRRMGGLWKFLPFECLLTIVCMLNLSGLPFTLGFFMKHVFLLSVLDNIYYQYGVFLLSFLAACCGLIYCSRLFFNVFFDFKKADKFVYQNFNKKTLSSRFYSNTTQASCIAIFLLVSIGYALCYYLFLNFWKSSLNLNILGGVNCASVDVYLDVVTTNKINFFISFINWFLVLIMLAAILLIWRQNVDMHLNYIYVYFTIVYLIFFYIFTLCI